MRGGPYIVCIFVVAATAMLARATCPGLATVDLIVDEIVPEGVADVTFTGVVALDAVAPAAVACAPAGVQSYELTVSTADCLPDAGHLDCGRRPSPWGAPPGRAGCAGWRSCSGAAASSREGPHAGGAAHLNERGGHQG